MSAPQDAAVTPADPVLDAELIDDDRPTEQHQQSRVVLWWQRCPRVPAMLKSRMQAAQAGKDAAVTVICAPWRFVGATARGVVHAARTWRRWVRVRDYREAAEQAEKLADKFIEIRALTLFRWRVTGAVTVTSGVGVAIAATGRRSAGAVDRRRRAARSCWRGRVGASDGAPGRKAVLAGPRSLTWTMDPQVLVDAFRDAKLIGKDETLRLVERAHRQGKGWAITVDLPATRKAADVIKNRDALASALAVDEVQLIVERVRGRGGHAGRVAMWVADEDPYATPPVPTPLVRGGALGCVGAGAVRPRRPGPARWPAAGVDLAAGGRDPAPGQDVRRPPAGRRADPGPAHPAVCVRRQGRQGLEGRRAGRLPVRLRRRARPCRSCAGRPGRAGRRRPRPVRAHGRPGRRDLPRIEDHPARSPRTRRWACRSPR